MSIFKGFGRRNKKGNMEVIAKSNVEGSAAETSKRATRIFLIRHGEPVQGQGKIFLGQFDVPLSEEGKRQALLAGKSLALKKANPKRIYTSDLLRARETADIIAEQLGAPVEPDKLFREMAMGIWDGELIEDIKAKFPGEYARRGDDLRNYRVPGGENFYDLHGRVTREFYRIFEEDIRKGGEDPGDIVIVAHLGVLNALAEEFQRDSSGPFNSQYYNNGEVAVFAVPDWL